jgi:arylsulfatase A-like enzyme
LLVAGFGLAGLSLLGCSPKRADLALAPPVILITIDTLRADHLGCYGYDKPTSPRLDEFAAQAT